MKRKFCLLGMIVLMLLNTAALAEIEQTGYSAPVPASYQGVSNQPGTMEALTYDSKDYVRDEAPIQKTAYVYLPYGYDAHDTETRYNILYLMHGWVATRVNTLNSHKRRTYSTI